MQARDVEHEVPQARHERCVAHEGGTATAAAVAAPQVRRDKGQHVGGGATLVHDDLDQDGKRRCRRGTDADDVNVVVAAAVPRGVRHRVTAVTQALGARGQHDRQQLQRDDGVGGHAHWAGTAAAAVATAVRAQTTGRRCRDDDVTGDDVHVVVTLHDDGVGRGRAQHDALLHHAAAAVHEHDGARRRARPVGARRLLSEPHAGTRRTQQGQVGQHAAAEPTRRRQREVT